jgi:hypothetical protein
MTNENFISFEEFKNSLIEKRYSEKNYEDIEIEMAKVEKAFAEGR